MVMVYNMRRDDIRRAVSQQMALNAASAASAASAANVSHAAPMRSGVPPRVMPNPLADWHDNLMLRRALDDAGIVQRQLDLTPSGHARQSRPIPSAHKVPAKQRTLNGRYRLDRVLGQGGFGVVFAARDLQKKRDVAVKFPWRQDRAGQRDLKKEADLMRRAGPGIAPHAFGIERDQKTGKRFFVMELLKGAPVYATPDILQSGRASVRAIDQTLASLAELHRRGIVHHDVKPDNLIHVKGHVEDAIKLIDFGMAQRKGAPWSSGFGALAWAAPEQLRTRANRPPKLKKSVPNVDVYGAGGVAEFLLTGDPNGPRCTTRGARVQLPGAPADQRETLERVVSKALRCRPSERYEDAGKMRKALKKAAKS